MLELKNIKKSYKTGDFIQHALKGVDIKFRTNEFVAILGPSGSGKTTLLNIIGGLDHYDSGDLVINNKSTKKFNDSNWDSYRNNCIGFIFQSYNLISHISVLENVEMSTILSGYSKKKRRKKALEALEKVGLKEHIHKKPNQLSGGQMQRVAIARSLVNDPDIILADEPTGALDTKTSKQIMDLIKEIAKDKLVIMVTHNPELAKDYATRIIEFKDGEILSDSDKVSSDEKDKDKFNIKKTKMSYKSAINLSFNNLKTKKGRTFITSFASSIGIIGIALILSLSNGFQIKIEEFEHDTLSQAPVVITEQGFDSSTFEFSEEDKLKEYTDKEEIYPLENMENKTHKNRLTLDYVSYIENIDNDLVGAISYVKATNFNILTKVNDKTKLINSKEVFSSLPATMDNDVSEIITDNFEAISGNITNNKEDIYLLVDSKNRINEEVLKILGFDGEKINFNDIVGKEFKLVSNNNYYKKMGDRYTINIDYDELYGNDSNLTLKIAGVIRGKKDSDFAKLTGTGLLYNETLLEHVIETNKESDIVKDQREVDYNILTLERFEDEEGEKIKDQTLAYLGADIAPIAIQIYPKDFNSKEKLLKYLDKYNKGKSEEDKIIYIDQAELITSLSGNIMDAITIVLIAFSSIALIVSSIMVGIITYTSVLERTKEIGILRALGARKKDIRRVFNAEVLIIGFASGLLGIIIARLLIFPINMIIDNLSGLPNVARLNPIHAIILILISIILTLIGGMIPARVASKKDPVIALRTE